jgi:hypothetical protein
MAAAGPNSLAVRLAAFGRLPRWEEAGAVPKTAHNTLAIAMSSFQVP